MLKLDEIYQIGGSERIKSLESELIKELSDLKHDIEENEMLMGAPRVASSVALPRDHEQFRQERKQIIERGLQVSEAHPLTIQADVLKEEMENSNKEEYTQKSLPLILHQTLEWLPNTHKYDIVPHTPSQDEDSKEEDIKRDSPDTSRSFYSRGDSARKTPFGDNLLTSRTSRPGSAATSGFTGPMSASVNLLSMHTVPTSVASGVRAAAGGGLASNEATQGIPEHVADMEGFKPLLEFLMTCYGITMDINQIVTSADEMELVANVNRKFRTCFAKQEQQRTFPTYDKIEMGLETWGADGPNKSLKKESNWLPFIKIKPERDPYQEKMLTRLRKKNNIDQLLKAQSRFLTVNDPVKVQEALKDHAVAVRDPPTAQPISVTSHRTVDSLNTTAIWRKIYLNSELYDGSSKADDLAVVDFDEKDTDNVSFNGRSSRAGSARSRKRKDSDEYDYFNAMQMLGLDEDDDGNQDPTMVQGGYLSLLSLRHLRIKDLQRTCLSVLNYFRSLERTLTINDGGLSLESNQQKRSSQNHRVGVYEGSQDGGGGLGSHHYLHYTPADFRVNEAEFMEFSEIDNHDDFYTVEEGRVHVQDQKGYYVIYDSALQDIKDLERDLLLIATHFIEKDKDHRDVENLSGTRRMDSARKRQSQPAGEVRMPAYGHQQVDRFAVLLDLWTNEAAFLENKRQLLDCYLEAYHNVFDKDEKRKLAQVITNLMHKRPRFDFASDYFIKTYRAESVCLRLHCTLIKSILDKQIEEQREYIHKVTRDGDEEFGLPHKIIPKQLINLNLSRPALKNVYMLEFHPCLAIASRLPHAINKAYFELYFTHRPKSITEGIGLEKKLLEVSLKQWENLDTMGNSYQEQVKKDLFADIFSEDPLFVCEVGKSLFMAKDEGGGSRRNKKEKQEDLLHVFCRLLDTITLRHRLIDAAWETEILTKLYKRHAFDMGFEEYHLFLRYVPFEFASFKENADAPPPVFITALHEDDSNVDRYVPSSLFLAVQELDEKHVGMFTFRNRDGFVKMVQSSGIDNLRLALQTQIVHKNALLSAVQLANVCSYFQEKTAIDTAKSGRRSPSDSRSEKSGLTALTAGSLPVNVSAMTSTIMFAAKVKTGMERHKRSPESFVSIQLEKVPSRDLMCNMYLNKKQVMGTLLKSNEEVEKLKRGLIGEFCRRFQRRISQYSLRSQIIAYLNSAQALLDEFPSIKQTHFICGLPNEKKEDSDDKKGLATDPRTLHKRPRKVISKDGTTVLNIWFLPHHSEVLIMFKKLDDDTCIQALRLTLQIIAALHDILSYLIAYSKLGSSNARLGSNRADGVTANWGGTEGISAELRQIQKQIDNLENPTNPQQVVDFLILRRDVMFLEFDTSVRHAMCDTFLSTGNIQAHRSVVDNMHFALSYLSNAQVPSLYSLYLPVPEPYEPRDFDAQVLVPWRAFLGRRGPFPLQFWEFRKIEYSMQLCMAGLKEVDRDIANGEILGVSLLMEDVLQTCQPDELFNSLEAESDVEDNVDPFKASKAARLDDERSERESVVSAVMQKTQPVSRTKEPLVAYGMLKKFLIMWKRLEVFKLDWGKRKLSVEEINTLSLYKQFRKQYKIDIAYYVLKNIARKFGRGDMYEGLMSDDEPLVAPQGASEMEIRAKQLIKLLDSLESHMIHEMRKKIAREHTLVVSERAREEGNLPTDLWKKPTINERMTIAKPHIAEDFSRLLMSAAKEDGDELVIKRESLNSALSQLANVVMQREKSNYESYSMYYENLLRQNHQLLYQREQEIKQLKDGVKSGSASALVEVQCQLADRSHELILEITALRAKIAEMRDEALTKERDIREEVKIEYDGLVQNLFLTSFALKTRFDEFRNHLYDDMFNSIGDVRRDAVETMSKLKLKPGGTEEEDTLQRNLRKAEELREIKHENLTLNRLVLKMKTMNKWKRTQLYEYYEKALYHLRQEADRCKKDYLEIKMMSEEEVILLRQQMISMKKSLANSEKEREAIQKLLDKEFKLKKEREHKAEREARSIKQLEHARASNLERLVEQLEDKDVRLKVLSEEHDKNQKMNHIVHTKVKKDVGQMKKQLAHERALKLDAFQRVDELQTQVYDIEVGQSSRPHTAGTMRTRSREKTLSRPSTGIWPPPVGMPPNRSLTPDPWPREVNADRFMQRPKTVSGRLRTRITEQLLYNDTPDQHETIMRLQEMERLQMQGQR
ncbi:uncharacterized protein LOC100372084 [Saccoglossus kowalevskii]